VVSHVVHYRHNRELFAYGPYAREIEIWADIFPEVVIASPCRDEAPPADCLPLARTNIRMHALPETGGAGAAKVQQILLLPWLAASLAAAMSRADAIHVRCPGNLGLLGALMARLFCRHRVAKYAGQWNGYENEPLTVRWQRKILASRWWGAPVTVYGQWPGQPAHVVSFFTSMMTEQQQRHAASVAAQRFAEGSPIPSRPLRVLCAGTLAARKRVDAVLEAVARATSQGVSLDVAIVGDGPDGAALRAQANALGIGHLVHFAGALPFDESLKWNEWADCLVLASRHSEGWPKVVAEGMSHGVLCIAVDHGQLRTMLTERGILMRSGSAEEIAEALTTVAADPSEWIATRQRAARWSTQHSLEGLRRAITDLLVERWSLDRNSFGPLKRIVAAGSGYTIAPQ
jgi:glycosyltransferase involved in cell wall biosynthesis